MWIFVFTPSRVSIVPHIHDAHPLLGHVWQEAALGQRVEQERWATECRLV